ncbi:MAG: hypothetical protein KDD33_03000 [Bdellovibrionales bacterium]|nr:hypothetical protein [Bdellovibrionales bacterium]
MKDLYLKIIAVGLILGASPGVFAQMVFSSHQNPPPSCTAIIKKKILALVNDANAVCRPEAYKAKSTRAKLALKRIARWKKFSKKMWDDEHEEPKRNKNGKLEPPLNPIISYDQAIVYMYSEHADECDRFNDRLGDALIELGHLNESCKQTLSYETIKRTWRDNLQMHALYERYSGKSEIRGVASQEMGTHFRPDSNSQ